MGEAPNHVGAESGVAFPAGTKSGLQLPVCTACCDVASRNNRNARLCFPNPSLALTTKSLNRFFNTVATRSRSLTSNDYPSLSPFPLFRTRTPASPPSAHQQPSSFQAVLTSSCTIILTPRSRVYHLVPFFPPFQF